MIKNFTKLALTASLLAVAAPALAVNDGFEAGNTSGWTLAGSGGATTGLNGSNVSLAAHSGSYLGYVASGSQNAYQTLSQAFNLNAGDALSGYVAFLTGDYVPYNDDGYLSVNGTNIFTSSVAAVGDGNGTGWTAFNFVAQTAGSYTLQIGVANRLDSVGTSYTAVDSVLVTAGVPEPAAWALMLGGFGLAGAAMRRRRANAVVYA